MSPIVVSCFAQQYVKTRNQECKLYKLDILYSRYDFKCGRILTSILRSILNEQTSKCLSTPTEKVATMVLETCFDYMYIKVA